MKIERKKNIEKKSFKYKICRQNFSGIRIIHHIREVHERKRKHQCDSCEKIFKAAEGLKKHIKIIHEGQRNYKRDFCGKFFTQSGHLKKHIMTIHQGQRNYKCDSCGMILAYIVRTFF